MDGGCGEDGMVAPRAKGAEGALAARRTHTCASRNTSSKKSKKCDAAARSDAASGRTPAVICAARGFTYRCIRPTAEAGEAGRRRSGSGGRPAARRNKPAATRAGRPRTRHRKERLVVQAGASLAVPARADFGVEGAVDLQARRGEGGEEETRGRAERPRGLSSNQVIHSTYRLRCRRFEPIDRPCQRNKGVQVCANAQQWEPSESIEYR